LKRNWQKSKKKFSVG